MILSNLHVSVLRVGGGGGGGGGGRYQQRIEKPSVLPRPLIFLVLDQRYSLFSDVVECF